MKLTDLLSERNKMTRDRQLRRAFSGASAPVIIDEAERLALVILINLSDKKLVSCDLEDEDAARAKLRNDEWLTQRIAAIEWLQTHNLKEPDARVRGRILAHVTASDELPFLCSATLKQEKHFSWSHNGACINHYYFLGAEFVFQGARTCLAEQFALGDSVLIRDLNRLGLRAGQLKSIQTQCRSFLQPSLPEEVDRFAKQVRVPFAEGSLAITPVVSIEMQRQIHCINELRGSRSKSTFHPHPASIGSFCAACGGRNRVFDGRPKLGRRQRAIDRGVRQKNRLGHMLEVAAIFNRESLRTLLESIKPVARNYTVKARKVLQQEQNTCLEVIVKQLFSRLDGLRYYDKKASIDALATENCDSWEYRYVAGEIFPNQIGQAASYFNRQIQILLSTSRYARQLAYHPELVRRLDQTLRHFLRNYLEEREEESGVNDDGYIILSSIEVTSANAFSTPYLIGLPSLTAVAGFVHKWQVNMVAALEEDLKFSGFAWLLHDYSLDRGHLAQEWQKAMDGKIHNPGIIDLRTCWIRMDLIVRVPSSFFKLLSPMTIGNVVEVTLPGRFAGGSIHRSLERESPSQTYYCRSLQQLRHYLRAAPPSSRLVTAFPLKADGKNEQGSEEMFQRYLRHLVNRTNVLPVSVGYLFLEAPQYRSGAIASTHVFAEPLLGLATLECPGPVGKKAGSLNRIFWQFHTADNYIGVTAE